MKKIRLFETNEEYNNSQFIYPTISYVLEDKNVGFKEYESYVIAKYNVTSETESVLIVGYEFDTTQVDKVYVVGIETEMFISGSRYYVFGSVGEHEVKITFLKGTK